ncbi:MAG: sigma-70 family RNA polymerase sigma factor [Oligoflexia bacterium]|nr:sigma-70 family RNA polymerase sigma factor [Oligoflexia bacterium]
MPARKTDAELVKEFRAGNTASFEELISRYASKAFSLSLRLTKNQEDAEEVLQDVFVTVFRKIDSFQGKSSFSSWLYRITVNSAFMKLRKRKQDRSVPIEELPSQLQKSLTTPANLHHETEIVTLRHELGAALEDAIRKLPDEYRPVFVLRDVDGLTSREVGKILNLTIPAVKSRLHRSRLMLRRKLKRLFESQQETDERQVRRAAR